MKAALFFLMVFFAACSNNNDGNLPKPENPSDHTEAQPPKDTNRLETPAPDSAANRPRGALFRKRSEWPADGTGNQTDSEKSSRQTIREDIFLF